MSMESPRPRFLAHGKVLGVWTVQLPLPTFERVVIACNEWRVYNEAGPAEIVWMRFAIEAMWTFVLQVED